MSDQNTTPEPQPTETDSRGVQDRVNQLVRQRGDAVREAESARAESAQLAGEVAELRKQVGALAQTPAPAPTPSLLKQQVAPAPDLAQVVAQAVTDAVGPINEAVQSITARDQTSQLQAAQAQSLEQAIVDMPEINVKGSDAQILANEIWQSHPELQAIAQGPAMVVQMVRGVLGTTSQRTDDARKVAASPPQPGAAPQHRLNDLPSEGSREQELLGKLSDKMRKGEPMTQDEQHAFYGLKLGRLSLKDK